MLNLGTGWSTWLAPWKHYPSGWSSSGHSVTTVDFVPINSGKLRGKHTWCKTRSNGAEKNCIPTTVVRHDVLEKGQTHKHILTRLFALIAAVRVRDIRAQGSTQADFLCLTWKPASVFLSLAQAWVIALFCVQVGPEQVNYLFLFHFWEECHNLHTRDGGGGGGTQTPSSTHTPRCFLLGSYAAPSVTVKCNHAEQNGQLVRLSPPHLGSWRKSILKKGTTALQLFAVQNML
jgi:hypothetical protein